MHKHNFTLMELVVSMTILALTGTVIATTLGIFINSYSNSQKAEKEIQRNLAIDRAVNKLFSGAVPFTWQDTTSTLTEGEDSLVFSGKYDELWLTAMGPAVPGKGAFTFARIFLENSELVIDSSPFPLLPWEEPESQNSTREVISGDVTSLEFRYALIDPDDSDNIIWYENWEESTEYTGTEQPETIPAAISMQCVFADGTELSWLRRTAGFSATGQFAASANSSSGTQPAAAPSANASPGGFRVGRGQRQ